MGCTSFSLLSVRMRCTYTVPEHFPCQSTSLAFRVSSSSITCSARPIVGNSARRSLLAPPDCILSTTWYNSRRDVVRLYLDTYYIQQNVNRKHIQYIMMYESNHKSDQGRQSTMFHAYRCHLRISKRYIIIDQGPQALEWRHILRARKQL